VGNKHPAIACGVASRNQKLRGSEKSKPQPVRKFDIVDIDVRRLDVTSHASGDRRIAEIEPGSGEARPIEPCGVNAVVVSGSSGTAAEDGERKRIGPGDTAFENEAV